MVLLIQKSKTAVHHCLPQNTVMSIVHVRGMQLNHSIELDAVYGVTLGMYCMGHLLNFATALMAFGIQRKQHVLVS